MYRQRNKTAAIRRVQNYLYEIQQYEGTENPTVQDGIYGEQTRAGIRAFQQRSQIKSTGIVDFETFEALRDTALQYKLDNARDDYLYSSIGFPLKFGSSGADVEVLHALLRSLSKYKKNLPPIPRGAYYSRETQRAIEYLQNSFLMEGDGIVTAALFDRLENELKANRAFDNSDFSGSV